MRRSTEVVKGAAALVGSLALLVGPPLVLALVVGNPLPGRVPTWEAVRAGFDRSAVPAELVINVLAIVLWAVWARFAWLLVTETIAALRGRASEHVAAGLGLRLVVAKLVASATLLGALLPVRVALATPLSASLAPPPARSAPALVVDDDIETTSVEAPAQPSPAPDSATTYRVGPRDTWWSIAETTLGDGLRWSEVRDLNIGRTMADGHVVGPGDDVVSDGWEVLVPGHNGADQAQPATAAEPEKEVVVVPGDTLWDIAEHRLGDPYRWPELHQANVGVTQPDGDALEDPDLIRPGWELSLPGGPEPAQEASSTPADVAAPPTSADESPTAANTAPQRRRERPLRAPSRTNADAGTTGSSSEPMPTTATAPSPPASAPPAPTTAAPSTAPTPARSGDEQTLGPIRLGPGTMRVAGALALGLPVFAAGGVALHLNRRRRTQLARHRPGRDIVLPDPALEPVERAVRAIATDEAAEWVDGVVRILTSELRQSSLPVPQITCVRAGELGLEVLLAAPAFEAPPSFTLDDDGYVWRLHANLDLDDVRGRAAEALSALPALVSVGASPEGPLLVDLEALGVLSVEGDDERVSAFLAGVALQLATAPWAEGVDLRVVGTLSALATVEDVTVTEDLASLSAELTTLATSSRQDLGDRPSTLAARLADSGEDWPPTVAVFADTPSAADIAELTASTTPGCGVAVAARGPIEGATWRLAVVADGFARLEPLGLDVHIAGHQGGVDTDIGSLDGDAIAAAAALVSAASHDDDVAPLVELGADVRHSPARPRRPEPVVRVDVLGPVQVSGLAKSVARRRKLEELLIYLATHDKPLSGEQIRCAMWPIDEEISAEGFVQAVSRLRSHLGGRELLPEASRGAYRLGPAVGATWTDFQDLATAALAARANPQEAIAHWRQALEMVRGEPFAGVAKGTYAWAWSERHAYAIQVAITRAADALGTLALAQDDPETALWATRQGLLAMPQQLSLFDWEMRVAAHRGDLDGLNNAYAARRAAEHALDPLSDVPPETVQLYEVLRAGIEDRRRSRAASQA